MLIVPTATDRWRHCCYWWWYASSSRTRDVSRWVWPSDCRVRAGSHCRVPSAPDRRPDSPRRSCERNRSYARQPAAAMILARPSPLLRRATGKCRGRRSPWPASVRHPLPADGAAAVAVAVAAAAVGDADGVSGCR